MSELVESALGRVRDYVVEVCREIWLTSTDLRSIIFSGRYEMEFDGREDRPVLGAELKQLRRFFVRRVKEKMVEMENVESAYKTPGQIAVFRRHIETREFREWHKWVDRKSELFSQVFALSSLEIANENNQLVYRRGADLFEVDGIDNFNFYQEKFRESGGRDRRALGMMLKNANAIIESIDEGCASSMYGESFFWYTEEGWRINLSETANDIFSEHMLWVIERLHFELGRLHDSGGGQIANPFEPEEEVGPQPNPIPWNGTDADLVELFSVLRGKHYFDIRSDYKLYQLLALHFTGKGGKRLDPKNLKSGRKKRATFGGAFDCIPENQKPE